MMDWRCPRCQRVLRQGMRFCPGCGMALTGDGAGSPGAGGTGAIRFTVPQQPIYPMPYGPMPGMYPYTPSTRRSQAVVAGVTLIIAGCCAFLGGLFYLLDSWWWTDFWMVLAVMCFAAFFYALVGALGLFQRRWRLHSLLSSLLLAFVGFFTLLDLTLLSIVIIVMAVISLIFVALSWRQAEESQWMGMMRGSGAGHPFWNASPPFAPPAGAPPPSISVMPAGFDQGAKPPPPVPLDEDGDWTETGDQGS